MDETRLFVASPAPLVISVLSLPAALIGFLRCPSVLRSLFTLLSPRRLLLPLIILLLLPLINLLLLLLLPLINLLLLLLLPLINLLLLLLLSLINLLPLLLLPLIV